MEMFLRQNKAAHLDFPPVDGQNTIFEYFTDEDGQWKHWDERVSQLFIKKIKKNVLRTIIKLKSLKTL